VIPKGSGELTRVAVVTGYGVRRGLGAVFEIKAPGPSCLPAAKAGQAGEGKTLPEEEAEGNYYETYLTTTQPI